MCFLPEPVLNLLKLVEKFFLNAPYFSMLQRVCFARRFVPLTLCIGVCRLVLMVQERPLCSRSSWKNYHLLRVCAPIIGEYF